MRAGALGESCGPASVCWVGCARRTEPDGAAAMLSGAGALRSKFAERPLPAVPPNALVSAVRAGSADGLLVFRAEEAAAGAAIAVGEAAMAAVLVERAGEFVGRDVGLIVGVSAEVALVVGALANCGDGD